MGQKAARPARREAEGEWLHPAPTVDYHREWRAFAVRRNVALFLLGSWVPACIVLYLWAWFGTASPLLSLVAIAAWLAAALAAAWWAGEFRCPRCRRRYGSLGHRRGNTNLTRGLFDRVCANCRLKKFENG